MLFKAKINKKKEGAFAPSSSVKRKV